MLSKLLGLLAASKGGAIAVAVVVASATTATVAASPNAQQGLETATSAVSATVTTTATQLSQITQIFQTTGQNEEEQAELDVESCEEAGGGQPAVVSQRNAADKLLRIAFQEQHLRLTQARGGGKDVDHKTANDTIKAADDALRATLTDALNAVGALTLGREGQNKPSAAPSPTPTATPTASPSPTPTETASASPTASPTGSPTESPSGSPTASPTGSPAPTCAPEASETPEPTATPEATETPEPTATPEGDEDTDEGQPELTGREKVALRTTLDADLQQIVDDATAAMQGIVDEALAALASPITSPAVTEGHGKSGEHGKPETAGSSGEHGKPATQGRPENPGKSNEHRAAPTAEDEDEDSD